MTTITSGTLFLWFNNIKRSFPLIRCFSTVITGNNAKQRLTYLNDRFLFKHVTGVYQQQPLQYITGVSQTALKQSAKIITKRPVRKKPTSTIEDEETKKVTAYAVGEGVYLDELRKALSIQGLYDEVQLPVDAVDAIHVKAKYAVNGDGREIFFFREGSVIFWNMPYIERNEMIRFLQKYCDDPYDISLSIRESENMEYKISESGTSLVGDRINLCNLEKSIDTQDLEKYTSSNALTQSVKLAIWESSLENFISAIEQVTQDLRDGKKIKMSRREVLRKTGELFALRHEINLSSDLLDAPDFYWDREVLESLYQRICNHLNIARRTRILNERISHCCELTELLSSHLNDTHHVRLEWMIIILIMVEVVFETIHYMDRYFSIVPVDEESDVKRT